MTARTDDARQRGRDRYARNKEAILARRKAARAAQPEHAREMGREQMRRWRATNPRISPAHGLSTEEVAVRLAQQGGVCAICLSTSPGSGKARWHGDHDHETGNFRGVLCGKCNMGIGLLGDSIPRVRAAVGYLERHAALQDLL